MCNGIICVSIMYGSVKLIYISNPWEGGKKEQIDCSVTSEYYVCPVPFMKRSKVRSLEPGRYPGFQKI